MLKTQLFIAAALMAGVAIGYFAGGHGTAGSSADGSAYVAKKSVADKGEAASVKALRRRVAELERLLAERGAPSEADVSSEVAGEPNPPRSGNPQEWLENLKKNDPARYVQVTNRWAQWRQQRLEQAQSKLEFLSSVDVSRLGPKAQEAHNELLDLIARREELMDQIHQEGLTEAQRHRLRDEMFATDREMRKLNNQERSNLISMAARNAGVKGKMTQELTATIKDVIKATESGWGGHGHHHGGPHGPRPGGPKGGAGGR